MRILKKLRKFFIKKITHYFLILLKVLLVLKRQGSDTFSHAFSFKMSCIACSTFQNLIPQKQNKQTNCCAWKNKVENSHLKYNLPRDCYPKSLFCCWWFITYSYVESGHQFFLTIIHYKNEVPTYILEEFHQICLKFQIVQPSILLNI